MFKTCLIFLVFSFIFSLSQPVFAGEVTAEYKCTKRCQFCVTMGKKTVCSQKYAEESEDFDKGRQLKKFVNDGLIIPENDLKPGFTLEKFNQLYFNCELMVQKLELMKQATQNMCVAKTVRYEKQVIMKRKPAEAPAKKSVPKKALPKGKKSKYSK